MTADELLAKLEAEFGEASLGGNPVVMLVKVIADAEAAGYKPKNDDWNYAWTRWLVKYCEEEVEVWEGESDA